MTNMKTGINQEKDEQQRMNIYITLLAVPFVLVAGYILASIFSLQEFFYPNKWGISVSWLVVGIIGFPTVILFIWFFIVRK